MPDEQYYNSVTGEAIPDFPILTKGSGKTSNIILALSGLPPFDGSTFQQMPVNGPAFLRFASIRLMLRKLCNSS
jgi:hypothetical protein